MDAILNIYMNVTAGMVVYEKVIRRRVMEKLPFMATENIMMESVKRGGNRQELHEIIRKCSMAAAARMKNGEPWDLLADLAESAAFGMTKQEMEAALEPANYIGRCPEQVDRFLAGIRHLLSDIGNSDPQIDL